MGFGLVELLVIMLVMLLFVGGAIWGVVLLVSTFRRRSDGSDNRD